MTPRKAVDPNAYYRDKLESIRPKSPPRSREFQNVESRYRSPPKPRAPPNDATQRGASPVKREEVEERKRIAAAQGFASISSKFYEVHMRPPPTDTPRVAVEEKLKHQKEEVSKNGQQFRIKHVKEASFKQMEKSNRELQELWNSPTKRSAHAHSIVMSFVNKGMPIPGYEPPPPKKPEPEPTMGGRVFLGGGGAGGGSFYRRTNSPKKAQAAAEEKKVQQLAEAMSSARTRSPPRVAAIEPRRAADEPRTVSPLRGRAASGASSSNGSAPTGNVPRVSRVAHPTMTSPTRRNTSPSSRDQRTPLAGAKRGPAAAGDSPTPAEPPTAQPPPPAEAASSAPPAASYFRREPPPILFDTQPPKLSAIR